MKTAIKEQFIGESIPIFHYISSILFSPHYACRELHKIEKFIEYVVGADISNIRKHLWQLIKTCLDISI